MKNKSKNRGAPVKSIAFMIAVLVVVALLAYVLMAGVSFGIYDIGRAPEKIKLGLDLTGGVSVVYEAKNLNDPALAENLDMAMTIFRTRLTAEGFPEATVTQQGAARVRIEIPINETSAVQDPNEITQYLVQTAKVEFRDAQGGVIFEGKDIDEVFPAMEGAAYIVSFKLNDTATAAFERATTAAYANGEAISIFLDDEMISSPMVNSVIPSGEAYIEGDFTVDTARQLANQIRSGVLPLEMAEIEVRSITATLGVEALSLSLTAGLIGILLIFLFMLIIYRLPGLVADLALIIYMLIMLFALATIPGVQLTLPGIAGIILSIGMAVDANVIIFERMKEELRLGKSLRVSVRAGFARAFSAILDSNVTTVIAAIVLMIFGTGPIRGFAVTLLIGIITSFISAVFVTRGLLNLTINMGIGNRALYYSEKRKAAVEGGEA